MITKNLPTLKVKQHDDVDAVVRSSVGDCEPSCNDKSKLPIEEDSSGWESRRIVILAFILPLLLSCSPVAVHAKESVTSQHGDFLEFSVLDYGAAGDGWPSKRRRSGPLLTQQRPQVVALSIPSRNLSSSLVTDGKKNKDCRCWYWADDHQAARHHLTIQRVYLPRLPRQSPSQSWQSRWNHRRPSDPDKRNSYRRGMETSTRRNVRTRWICWTDIYRSG